jgi:outer membrane usher protein FimD/PapC
VVDAQDAPVGVVDAQGTVFLANAINLGRLWISGPELARCELHFELPEQPDVEAYYETAPAVCRAS